MFTTLRSVGLAAAVMLAVQGTSKPQSGDFMKVPQEVWTNINRFVFLVALDEDARYGGPGYGPLKDRRSVLASWPEVYAAGLQWSVETFPALQQLAAELAQGDIADGLQLMLKAAEDVARGRADQRGTFDAAATAIETKIARLLSSSAIIKGQVDRVNAASGAVKREILQRPTPDVALLDIQIKAEQASAALGASLLAWSGLQSDVTELRRVVKAAQQVDPSWYARISIKRWDDVARDARGFLTDMKTQQRYLAGEDYYDNCGGLAEGGWYTLHTATGYLKASVVNYTYVAEVVDLPKPDFTPAYLWQFKKGGKGWWRLANMEIQVYQLRDSSYNNGSGFWRALPVTQGRCYLVPLSEGGSHALEAMPNNRVNLVPTTKTERQQWSFSRVTP
jgi:hypothetical protein